MTAMKRVTRTAVTKRVGQQQGKHNNGNEEGDQDGSDKEGGMMMVTKGAV